MLIDHETISLIQPNLYIGTWVAAIYATMPERLKIPNKIDVVISALTEDEYEEYDFRDEDFEDVSWYRLVIDDCPYESINEHFERVHLIINNAISQGKTVLVHCAAGMSRSPTLVAAHLLLDKQFDSEQVTIDYLKNKRPIVNPNTWFRHVLSNLLENIKNGTKYVSNNNGF